MCATAPCRRGYDRLNTVHWVLSGVWRADRLQFRPDRPCWPGTTSCCSAPMPRCRTWWSTCAAPARNWSPLKPRATAASRSCRRATGDLVRAHRIGPPRCLALGTRRGGHHLVGGTRSAVRALAARRSAAMPARAPAACTRMIGPAWRPTWKRALARCEPLELEFRIAAAGARWRHCWAEGQCEFDGHGQPVAVAGNLQDITERKEAEATLVANEKLNSIGTDRRHRARLQQPADRHRHQPGDGRGRAGRKMTRSGSLWRRAAAVASRCRPDWPAAVVRAPGAAASRELPT